MNFVTTYSQMQGTVMGQNVYVSYSPHKELKVKQPQGEASTHDSHTAETSPVLLVTVRNMQYPVTIEALNTIFTRYGVVLRIVLFTKKDFQAFVEMSSVEQAILAKQSLDGLNIYTGCCTLSIQFGDIKTLSVKFNNERSRDFVNTSLPSGGSMAPQMGMPVGSALNPMIPGFMGDQPAVLHVSGFNPDDITCDKLQNLFGFFGDVHRVKIMFNKKDTALLQFSNAKGAETALQYLNKVTYHGKQINCKFSPHPTVSMPPEGEEGANLTKDYSTQHIHRFAKGANSYKHVCTPTPVVHISNLTPTMTEEKLTELFSNFGPVVKTKMFTSGDNRMAYVQYTNVDDSITALMSMHQVKVEDATLRISFTKLAEIEK
eukprot:TRINITY_DN3020_c1_g1_i1.p1 TRINITY_DN3020_c1_g1~~TRINITY_DN3020_c1_g1_i1.p1  ORF type:complete len:374 (+),score=85.55 TRINITY_DN3020_c1_g1_i1:494-1615(+)